MGEQPIHPFTAGHDNREGPRTLLAIPAKLRLAGHSPYATTVHNLSLAGFNASAIGTMRPAQICWLMIPGLESLQSEVIWHKGTLAGFRFYSALSPVVFDHILAKYPRRPLW